MLDHRALLTASLLTAVAFNAFAAAPAKPTNLALQAVSSSQVNVSWTDSSSNETGFELERRPSTVSTFSQIATLASNATSYSDSTALTAGTKYYYRIRSFNTSKSAYTSSAYTTTLSTLPNAPANLAVSTVSTTSIQVTWTDKSTDETKFVLERKTGATGTYAQIATPTANTVSYTNTGLAQGTTYYFRVAATNAAGNSAYSNEVTASTTVSAPTKPSSLTLTASTNQINLNWADMANNETGFEVQRKLGSSGIYATIASLGANVVSYSDSNLSEGQQYFYQVRAVNSGGNSAYVTANTSTLISAPSNLIASPVLLSLTPFQINLTWQDNSSQESGFKLEEATVATGPWTQVATIAANSTSYQRTGLLAGKKYFYRLTAYIGVNNSTYTTTASATTTSPRLNQLPQPKGVYLLSDNSGEFGLNSLGSLDKPFIDGFSWRIGWRELDTGTTAPKYDFTAVDNAIAGVQAVSKKLNIALFALEVPDYVKASAQGLWMAPGTRRGTTVETVVPWDVNSLESYRSFLAALSNHEVFDNATGSMMKLRDHSALAHINAGILGIQGVRDSTNNLINHPGFTRSLFKNAMIDSIKAMQLNFPDRVNYIAYWGLEDGNEPSFNDELLTSLLETFDGNNNPMIGFFNEALKGDSPSSIQYQSAVKNGHYMMFQACGSWTLHDLCSWTAGDNTPANGMKYGFDNFGAKYFEIYRNDIENTAFQADLQLWHTKLGN